MKGAFYRNNKRTYIGFKGHKRSYKHSLWKLSKECQGMTTIVRSTSREKGGSTTEDTNEDVTCRTTILSSVHLWKGRQKTWKGKSGNKKIRTTSNQ